MPTHVRPPSRSRSKVALGIAMVAASATVTVALTQTEARVSDRTAAAAEVDSPRVYACAGRAVDVRRTSDSAVTLACLGGVTQVGQTQTYVGTKSAAPRTALPAGTTAGTLLVATVQTPATSTVSMSGWTKAYDEVSGPNGLRLSAWYRIATAGEGVTRASVTPAARVSMITTAFAGADTTTPIGFAAGASGLTAPSAPAASAGTSWLSSLGVQGRRSRVERPNWATKVRTLQNGDMRTAQTLVGAQQAPVISWTGRRVRSALAGLVSVVPGRAAEAPAGAIALAAGETKEVTCDAGPLDYVAVSAAVTKVTCRSVRPTSTRPSWTRGTTHGGSTSSSTTSTTAKAPVTTTTTAAGTTTRPTKTTTTSPTRSSPTSKRPSSSTTTTAPSGSNCTSPAWTSSKPDAMWTNGGYVVHNNMWNASGYSISQTTAACSYTSWYVTATADNSRGDGAVKTYPNIHRDYHDWNQGSEPAWSSFSKLQSTFAARGPGVGIYNIAYDIWLNGVPGNREIMIWTENHNQRPAGSRFATVNLSGITWDVWATGGNGYLAFVPQTPLTSGSLDVKAMINWLIGQGRVQSNATVGQVCFGVEIVSTDGKPATFQFTDFSVTS